MDFLSSPLMTRFYQDVSRLTLGLAEHGLDASITIVLPEPSFRALGMAPGHPLIMNTEMGEVKVVSQDPPKRLSMREWEKEYLGE